jgi:hypothetical protein
MGPCKTHSLLVSFLITLSRYNTPIPPRLVEGSSQGGEPGEDQGWAVSNTDRGMASSPTATATATSTGKKYNQYGDEILD